MRRIACLLLLLIGCDGTPPFDELPLRDGLRASPDAVAALPPEARARFAARLNAARDDRAVDDVAGDALAALVKALDRARETRGADALVVGSIDGAGHARALSIGAADEPTALDDSTLATTAAERRALAGAAGTALRALAAASGARRLHRVLGWPVGAVAIGDTIHVNAAWLVALAGDDADAGDAGADTGATAGPGAASAAGATTSASSSTRSPARLPPAPVVAPVAQAQAWRPSDGGAPDTSPAPEPDPPAEEPTPAEPDSCAVAVDGCGSIAEACGSTDTNDDACSSPSDDSGGSDDACSSPSDDSGSSDDACSNSDGSDDACSNSDSSGGDDCSGSGDDAQACAPPSDDGAASCQIGRRHAGNGRPSGTGTFVCLLAPFGLLLVRGRR